ncbi:glycosyltransferase-like protein [Selaginella moellendorffii]|uniref:Glycosyltransferase-like protein n=1 Tax=Selaginella moellendorffii TaxID=88036 RepID=D8R2M1_SELML|nr:uncharacterized protein LOC9660460 [Selaginella moellendorffii]EFJ33751.1 glycosyltransferase-like protein [Selaginella moellendorffii]|eukprot:XP_002964913.1 uncharacterized protein LOC9660460 [Selaginella moellendorffii]
MEGKEPGSRAWRPALGLPAIFQLALAIFTVCFLIQQLRPPPSNASYDRAMDRRRERGQDQDQEDQETRLSNILFGIGAASSVLERRKDFIKAWWRPGQTRGFVFVDQPPPLAESFWDNSSLPELRISESTARFRYTFPRGRRSAIRISRIVSEMFRMGLPGVRWFVLGDDDTVFFVDNLARVLAKYDHTKFFYVGSSSENHLQNVRGFSSFMAYGGGGFAISYALAEALAAMQDDCLERYHFLYGSDDRIQACMAELGVQLTREPGFHQLDVLGDASGLLAAHPIAPALSLHHLNVIHPLFPNATQRQSINRLFSAARIDPAGIFQQSICYDRHRNFSIQVSWGYLVQVSQELISPRILELPLRTFVGWYGERSELSFPFKTRALPVDLCQRPVRFYMESVKSSSNGSGISVSNYVKSEAPAAAACSSWLGIETILVDKEASDESWYKALRRQCCKILESREGGGVVRLEIRQCS